MCVIRALDGTWHRPFTTLDLAALQSLYDPDDYAEAAEQFVLHGRSDQPGASASATPYRRRPPGPWPKKSAGPSCCRAPANLSNCPALPSGCGRSLQRWLCVAGRGHDINWDFNALHARCLGRGRNPIVDHMRGFGLIPQDIKKTW